MRLFGIVQQCYDVHEIGGVKQGGQCREKAITLALVSLAKRDYE